MNYNYKAKKSNYAYVGTGEDKEYDENYFNTLTAQHRYTEAADYLDNYSFQNPEVEKNRRTYANNLRRDGEKINGMLGRIEDEDMRNQYELWTYIKSDGGTGIDSFKQRKMNENGWDEDQFNKKMPFVKDIFNIYDKLGGDGAGVAKDDGNGHITYDSTAPSQYQLKFKYKKCLWGGSWGILNDVFKKDDDETEAWFKKAGVDADYFKSKGSDYYKKDDNGDVTVLIDRNDPKLFDLLSNLPQHTTLGAANSNAVEIRGKDKDGNFIDKNFNSPVTSNGRALSSVQYNEELHTKLAEYRERMENVEQGMKNKDLLPAYQVTGDVLQVDSDALHELECLHDTGQIGDTEYNNRKKEAKNFLGEAIKVMSEGGYDIYSNYNNGSSTDELTQTHDWTELREIFSNGEKSKIHVNYYTDGNTMGTIYTIDAGAKIGDKKTLEERVQVYIPNLFTESLQELAENDTRVKAKVRASEMKLWGIKHKLRNGDELKRDEAGNWYRNNKHITDYSELANMDNELLEDYNVVLGKNSVKFKYLNENNEINYADFEKNALMYAFQCADEEIQGVALQDIFGEELTYETLLNLLNNNVDISSEYQYDVARKIRKAKQIFEELKDDADTHPKIANRINQ